VGGQAGRFEDRIDVLREGHRLLVGGVERRVGAADEVLCRHGGQSSISLLATSAPANSSTSFAFLGVALLDERVDPLVALVVVHLAAGDQRREVDVVFLVLPELAFGGTSKAVVVLQG